MLDPTDPTSHPEYRRRLVARKADLAAVADTAADAGATVELDQTRVGRLSRMDALQAQAMARESNRRREVELKRIDSALARLDAGDYGFCLRCDEPIAAARLEFDPSVPLCVRCADA
ncbi:MAG: TraR/DksA C4-type zinc finger protein [Pseudomonadota bacterium]